MPEKYRTSIIVVGVNHHASPVRVRERLSVSADDNAEVLEKISRLPHIRECVVLSTCNRTEVYAVVDNVVTAIREIESFLLKRDTLNHTLQHSWLRLLRSDAVLHLLRVASGLDSMILGEAQILAQVKNAHEQAIRAGTIGPILKRAFKSAIACGKRVRSETEIARRPVSVASAAVELGKKNLANSLSAYDAVVVGSGEMATICISELLSDCKTQCVKVVTRSQQYATMEKWKEKYGAKLEFCIDYESRHFLAARADLVIVATSAPNYVLNADELKEELGACEKERDICVIDISVPRTVDPELTAVQGVNLFGADNLAAIVAQNKNIREEMLDAADEIVFAELEDFANWELGTLVVPTVKKLRDKFEQMRIERLESLNSKMLKQASGVEKITKQLINQILHEPTMNLKAASGAHSLKIQDVSRTVELLFSL